MQIIESKSCEFHFFESQKVTLQLVFLLAQKFQNFTYFYSMNWKETIIKYFPDVWQYLIIIVIFIIAAIFIL